MQGTPSLVTYSIQLDVLSVSAYDSLLSSSGGEPLHRVTRTLGLAAAAWFVAGTAAEARFLQTDPVGYSDSMNLYEYVRNDPINLFDPSGRECTGDGKTLTCDPPGDDTPAFSIPQQQGFPNYIGPASSGYHQYRAETSTPDVNGSLAGPIAEQIAANPTPGVDQPATASGTLNDAGITPFSGRLGDQVRSYTTTDVAGNSVVVNVTVPGEHVLNPGIVAQYTIGGDTSTSVIAVGEGNALLSVPANPIAAAVFQNKIERDVRIGITSAVRARRF